MEQKPASDKKIVIKIEKSNFTQITNQITKNNKLTDFAIRLYCYLKSHSDNFYLSYRKITNYLKISEHKLRNGIKELKQSGFLQIERKPNSNEYKYLLLDAPTNNEYKIKEQLKNNSLDFTDIKNIYRILNDGKITQETRDEINKKLKEILSADWTNEDY